MCVVLDYFAEDNSSDEETSPEDDSSTEENEFARYKERLKSFHCPGCHIHATGMYPVSISPSFVWSTAEPFVTVLFQHLIKNPPFYEPRPESPPQLAFFIYYLSQFWPLATQLMAHLTSVWKTNGWGVSNFPHIREDLLFKRLTGWSSACSSTPRQYTSRRCSISSKTCALFSVLASRRSLTS